MLANGIPGDCRDCCWGDSLTSHNYNLMVFTCKLFPVAEPVGGNNFINYALDTDREASRGVDSVGIEATAGDAPCCFSV